MSTREPSVQTEVRRGLRYNFGTQRISDFSGGLNLRDAPAELAPNEMPDLMNVTLDERGGIVKRLGQVLLASGLGGPPLNVYYSQNFQRLFFQVGATIYATSIADNFGTLVTLTPDLANSSRAAFCDFHGKVLIVHQSSGLQSFSGAAALTAIGTGPLGTTITTWQDKLWVSGNGNAPTRVYASGVADETDWNTAGAGGALTVDIREQDEAPITCIGSGQGMDISGRPGLLVFKKRATYRINDVSNGAYTTLSVNAGAVGPDAVTAAQEHTYSFSETGVWQTDGVSPSVLLSQKISPLFAATQINYSSISTVTAATFGTRIFFSFPFGTSQVENNRTLEYHTSLNAFTIHDFGYKALLHYPRLTEKLYGGGGLFSGGSVAASSIHRVFSGWDDDGAAIAARFQTRWMEYAGDNETRLRRLRVSGRGGAASLYVKKNFQTTDGTLFPVIFDGGAGVWNTATWGNATWGSDFTQAFEDFWELGVAKAFSFEFRESAMTTAYAPPLLDTGPTDPIGSFAIYSLHFDYVPLGLS